MRAGIVRLTDEFRGLLSNDLGCAAGLLFDVGSGRYAAPPRDEDAAALAAWEAALAQVRAESAASRKAREASAEGDRTHTEIQSWLRDLGRALGFDVWIAANDRNRPYGTGRLGDGCLDELPSGVASSPAARVVELIDVLWVDRGAQSVAAAFEVEHTTSIHSGIVRLLDLALGGDAAAAHALFLVAPDDREEEVRTQLRRPAFRSITDLRVRYVPYGELERHRESMARFGTGLRPLDAVARSLG